MRSRYEYKKSDCDILIDNTKDVFGDLGNCFESAFDEKQTKMGVVKDLVVL